jgi:hypothetical protein
LHHSNSQRRKRTEIQENKKKRWGKSAQNRNSKALSRITNNSQSICSSFSTQRLLASSIGFGLRRSPSPYQKDWCEVVGKKGKSEKCVKVYYSFPNKQPGLT